MHTSKCKKTLKELQFSTYNTTHDTKEKEKKTLHKISHPLVDSSFSSTLLEYSLKLKLETIMIPQGGSSLPIYPWVFSSSSKNMGAL
jgi:hypothetical protein